MKEDIYALLRIIVDFLSRSGVSHDEAVATFTYLCEKAKSHSNTDRINTVSPSLSDRNWRVLRNLAATMAHNIERTPVGGGLFERVVFSDGGLPPEAVEEVHVFLREHGQRLLERIDDLMCSRDSEKDEQRVDVGVGLYLYTEKPNPASPFFFVESEGRDDSATSISLIDLFLRSAVDAERQIGDAGESVQDQGTP